MMEDVATALRTTKIVHSSQLARYAARPFLLPVVTFVLTGYFRLSVKSQEELAQVDDLRNFMKRRAEIESSYQDELVKLCAQYQQQRKQRSPHERYVKGDLRLTCTHPFSCFLQPICQDILCLP